MGTIAIVGAGSGLGRAIAERFGREGFEIALIARNHDKLGQVRDALIATGLTAEAFPADVTDRDGLVRALDQAAAHFGAIDVLEYSPAPAPDAIVAVEAAALSVEAVAPEVELYLYGGITAVQQVLPRMRERGAGTIIVSTGASSGPVVYPPFANIAAGSAGLRNWTLNLHAALEGTGVYVAHVALAVYIGSGHPGSDPAEIAESYWQLYSERTQPELFYSALPEARP